MQTKAIVLAFAASAVADVAMHPGHLAVRRDLEIRATATSGDDLSCATSLLTLFTDAPTPPPEIISFAQTATITDTCAFTPPASLSSAFSSYEKEVSSWAMKHSSDFSSAYKNCPALTSYASSVAVPVCTTGGAVGGSSGDSNASGSGGSQTTMMPSGGNNTASGSSAPKTSSAGAAGGSSSSKAAAPRETGFVAAAVAAVGFVGAVAAL